MCVEEHDMPSLALKLAAEAKIHFYSSSPEKVGSKLCTLDHNLMKMMERGIEFRTLRPQCSTISDSFFQYYRIRAPDWISDRIPIKLFFFITYLHSFERTLSITQAKGTLVLYIEVHSFKASIGLNVNGH